MRAFTAVLLLLVAVLFLGAAFPQLPQPPATPLFSLKELSKTRIALISLFVLNENTALPLQSFGEPDRFPGIQPPVPEKKPCGLERLEALLVSERAVSISA